LYPSFAIRLSRPFAIVDELQIDRGAFRPKPCNFVQRRGETGQSRISNIADPYRYAEVEAHYVLELLSKYVEKYLITIAIMGCRVNRRGETDDADLGRGANSTTVNLKRRNRRLGNFVELDALIAQGVAVAAEQD
jgi:hypothetical protein